MPKGRFAVQPEHVTVTFHAPIDPAEFTDRDALMQAVRRSIDAGLPPQYQEALAPPDGRTYRSGRNFLAISGRRWNNATHRSHSLLSIAG